MKKDYISRCEQPVVAETFKQYESSRQLRLRAILAVVHLFIAIFTTQEIFHGSMFEDHVYYSLIWTLEIVLAFWSIFQLLSILFLCLQWFLFSDPVMLTAKQYELLAVSPTDKRFTPFKHQESGSHDHRHQSADQNINRSPIVPISSPMQVISPSGSPSCYTTAYSTHHGTVVPNTSGYFTQGYQDMPTTPLYSPSPLNMSLRNRLKATTESPYSPTKFSPTRYNDVTMSPSMSDMSIKYPSPNTSPFSDDRIRNVNALNSYLQSQEDRSDLIQRDGYSPSRLGSTSGFLNSSGGGNDWSTYGTPMEYYNTPINVYKIGTRSPLTTTSKDEDEYGHMSPQAEELWQKFHANRQDLDLWTENLRKWISQTILCKVVQEIDEINGNLQRIGSSELQIGIISLGSLRQVAASKAEHVPNLSALIPYLELSNNQEYLVRRIQELGKDSCMGGYHWKFGGDYRGRRWDQDLPTDAQIIRHVFCTYMDSRLPTDARFPDGRTFTGLYFLKNLDKPESKKRDLAIYRYRQNPPHFKVIVGDDVYDVGKGRNNLFHSIILFLLMVKRRHHGMLGRVNLGPSGVNILGIFKN